MAYRIVPAVEVARDLELIEEHLVQAYRGFGEDEDRASARAAGRIGDAVGYLDGLASHPHRGTEHPQIRAGLRSVTNNRFIYYFMIDEALSEVRLLALFFGGIDHRRQIRDRMQG